MKYTTIIGIITIVVGALLIQKWLPISFFKHQTTAEKTGKLESPKIPGYIPVPIQAVTMSSTKGWFTYTNPSHYYQFNFPSDWKIYYYEASQDEMRIYLRSPSTEKQFERKLPPPEYSHDLIVSFWPDINSFYNNTNGAGLKKTYDNLAEYMAEKNNPNKVIGKLTVAGQSAYEAILGGGEGANYSILIENGGIYHLSFETAWDKSELTTIQQQILSSFRFKSK